MTSSYYWSAERFFQTAPLTRIQNYSVNPFVITVKLLTAYFFLLLLLSFFLFFFFFLEGGGRRRCWRKGGGGGGLTIKMK